MNGVRKVRDAAVLDRLEAIPKRPFAGTAWRIVRADRDPLRSSAPKGRWDDGSFDVLYTSLLADGAKAEMYFHILRGQPVFTSLMPFRLFELDVKLNRVLTIPERADLAAFGIDAASFGGLGHARKNEEYSASQKVGEAAHFLDADALVVPNARSDCLNAVLFMGRLTPEQVSIRKDHGDVDCQEWKRHSDPPS